MSNPEDPEEVLAKKWLVSLTSDRKSVCRPKCDPPDYVLNGDIAVEVTRLSEQGRGTTSLPSLHSLEEVVEDVLKDLGPPGNGQSICVFWVYAPWPCLPKKKRMKKQIRNALMPYTERCAMPEKLRELSLTGIAHLLLPCGLSLRLVHRQSTDDAPSFKFCGFSGMTGEHVREKLLKDLERAVVEKAKSVEKAACKRGRSWFDTYSRWWLVLVDRVFTSKTFTFDGTNEGKRLLRDMTSLTQELARTEGPSRLWSRIVVLAPQAPCREYVLFDKDEMDRT